MTLSIPKLRQKWGSMSKEARASVAYAICSIVQKCISFINMPIFTRLMSTDEYGEMTVYSSWSGIFSIVLTLNLAYGSFSPAMLKFEKDRDRYISSIQGIWLVLSGFFLMIYLPLQGFWNDILDLPTLFVIFLILETLSINSINLWSGKKRFDYEYKPVVALTLLMSAANTAVSLAFVLLSELEGHLRNLLRDKILVVDLKKLCCKDSQEISSIDEMTFGDYVTIFGNEKQWKKLKIAADRKTFEEEFEVIRNIRNDVMHFRPSGLDDGKKELLKRFVDYLRVLVHYKHD